MNLIQRSRWSRRIVSVLVCLVVGWLLYDISMNVVACHFIQQISKDNPNLGVVPVPLLDNGQARLVGTKLTAFEYSLQTPWDDIETRRDYRSIAYWHFKNGAVVTMFRPSATNDHVSSLRSVKDRLIGIIGPRAFSSDFDLLASELNATPSQIHWWSTRTVKARGIFLLSLKTMDIMQSRVIYMQSSEDMHGFQFGDPAQPPYKIELDLFDRDDRRYRIWIINKSTDHTLITQPELNSLVASLKPIPHG